MDDKNPVLRTYNESNVKLSKIQIQKENEIFYIIKTALIFDILQLKLVSNKFSVKRAIDEYFSEVIYTKSSSA